MNKSVLDFQAFNNSRYNRINENAEEVENGSEDEIFTVYYIVGEEAVHLYEHDKFNSISKDRVRKEDFPTQAEAEAFEKGLKAVAGWNRVAGISETEYEQIHNEN